jgi:gamma-glutamyltranspeptidase / glutathione hydrolase
VAETMNNLFSLTCRILAIGFLANYGLLMSLGQDSNPIVAEETSIGIYDRPFGPIHQSRSIVTARNGMASTSDPRATQAAIEILKQGGSAVDAAIAANAVLGVVEPMSCGIGGDLYSIVWDAKTEKLYGLNASGRSPAKLTRNVFAEKNLSEIPLYGPLSWSVPGCAAGWHDLHKKFGKLPIDTLLAPAIRLAEEGFAVSPMISEVWKETEEKLSQHADSVATFLPQGKAPEMGEVFRNPNLAKTYRQLARHGLPSFYTGSIADTIVQYSDRNNGYFSKEDFTNHRNEWVAPISTNYRGYDVWQIPPNGQGLAVLQMLNVLSQFPVAEMKWGSAEYLHLLIEAKKLAYADRARYYADMAFEEVPVEQLNSIQYGKQQAARIDLNRAATNVEAGDSKLITGDTVYLCVVDENRNCCSLIQSNYYEFGSQMVPGDLGFTIQNRGNLFSLDPDHPNRLEPGKRPFHTIIPSIVTKDGKPVFVFGVMGGDMQPQGQVQVLVNWIDYGMNIQMAGDAARIRHGGSATPTGVRETPPGGIVRVESGIPLDAIEQLKRMGHTVEFSRRFMGGYQGILIDDVRGTLQGATESRNDGLALGLD